MAAKVPIVAVIGPYGVDDDGVAGRHGTISDMTSGWLDWMIKDGELQPMELSARQLYTNALNPFAAAPAATASR